jgi:hypothetical protein
MSHVTPDAEKTPSAAAQPGEPETKPKKAKGVKPTKKAKATKQAKPAKKAKPAKGRRQTPRRTNEQEGRGHRDDEAGKGATLPEIMEATGWLRYTIRAFVSILVSKGGEKIESSKNAAGERTYKIAK